MITMHPDVAYMFIGAGGDNIQRLEETIHRAIYVRSDDLIHREHYRIVPGDMQEMDRQLQRIKPRQIVELPIVKHPLTQAPRARRPRKKETVTSSTGERGSLHRGTRHTRPQDEPPFAIGSRPPREGGG